MDGTVIGYDEAGNPFAVPEGLPNPHALILGTSGAGKSTLAFTLIRDRLQRGDSLVAVDPEIESLRRLRGLCSGLMPPERVVLIDARDAQAAPGLNPFRAGIPPADAASAVNGLFEKMGAYDNALRVMTFMSNAVPFAAWHGLPLTDVLRMLKPTEEAYRAYLLASDPLHPPSPSYREARAYLCADLGAIKPTSTNETVQSIRMRFQPLLGNDLFLTMFGSSENTVDFDALFRRDLRQDKHKDGPGAILVCTREGGGMTQAGGQLLAGIVFDMLFAAADRNSGGRPTVLAVDEMLTLGPLMESTLSKIVTQARKRNLRLMLMAQHAGQLPDKVRADVLGNTAFQAYFNPGNDETNASALALARAYQRSVPHAEPEPEPEVKPMSVKLYGINGQRTWEGLVLVRPDGAMPSGRRRNPRPDMRPVLIDPTNLNSCLGRFMEPAREFLPWIGTKNRVPVSQLIEGVPPGCAWLVWREGGAWLEVDAPPKQKEPKAKRMDRTEHWIGPLGALRPLHAYLAVGTEAPIKVRIPWHGAPPDALDDYVQASRAASAAPAPVPLQYPVSGPATVAPESPKVPKPAKEARTVPTSAASEEGSKKITQTVPEEQVKQSRVTNDEGDDSVDFARR